MGEEVSTRKDIVYSIPEFLWIINVGSDAGGLAYLMATATSMDFDPQQWRIGQDAISKI